MLYVAYFSGEVEFEADSYEEALQKAFLEVPIEADNYSVEQLDEEDEET